MAWIKFEKDLLTDPRVLRIAKSLESRWRLYQEGHSSHGVGIGNDEALPAVTLVCGALVRIWCLADTHVGVDDVLPLGKHELDELLGVPGFCDLLPADWMVAIDETSVKLPDFHEHNGTQAKKKAVTQRRVAAFRSRNASELHKRNAEALPDQTQTRPRPNNPTAGRASAPAMPEGFQDAWQALPKRAGNNPSGRAQRAYKARLAEGCAPIAMLQGAQRYTKFIQATGKEGTEFVMQAATFFGPERPFLQSWVVANGQERWDASNDSILAKAHELGISTRGESTESLKAQIRERIAA